MSVSVITLQAPPVCEREILRYASCREADKNTLALLRECVDKALPLISYKVCYKVLDLKISGEECGFGAFCLKSKDLAKNLSGCERVLLFGATVGLSLDRLISAQARLSPARALFLQALGAERIEALCDEFCKTFEKENGVSLNPRFSAGYGDLALEAQKEIFKALNPEKNIGLFLNESLMMSPTKSVTAFAGISPEKTPLYKSKCEMCENKECAFRRI